MRFWYFLVNLKHIAWPEKSEVQVHDSFHWTQNWQGGQCSPIHEQMTHLSWLFLGKYTAQPV